MDFPIDAIPIPDHSPKKIPKTPLDNQGSFREGLPKSGAAIQCVLLAEKTRKGGWRAKLVNRELAGPITNSADVPQAAKPGQVVDLQVGAVSRDGTHIQFHWLPILVNGRGAKV
jgi:hypothetical protein